MDRRDAMVMVNSGEISAPKSSFECANEGGGENGTKRFRNFDGRYPSHRYG